MIDLTTFCEQGADPRAWMRRPFKEGEWVYATNGHVCVRVPAGGYPDADDKPEKFSAKHLFEKYIDGAQGEFVVLPKTIRKPGWCYDCHGRGHFVAYKCPDCDEGEFEHGDHSYTCKNCQDQPVRPGWMLEGGPDQPQEKMACERCRGHGLLHDDGPSVVIGGVAFDPVYAWWMSRLPQVRVRLSDKPNEAAAFIFDGGQALVMPRKD